MTALLNDRDIDFLLYEFLDTEALLSRPRYREYNRETLKATLGTAKTIAQKFFANHNAKGDANEPTFDGQNVHLIPETKAAWDAFAEAGFLAAHYSFEEGGMQLPEIVLRAAMCYINAANVSTSGYPFLTIGAGNLIQSFGSIEQKRRFLEPMKTGRFAGTMALTEPGQGSALADIKTKAVRMPDDTYRLFGQKMFISGGDHNLTENIVHMVLARIEGAPAGTKGISMFICPKVLVDHQGQLAERNDVALAGLLHKMGYRNTASTVLNFGEKEGAVAYLVGEPNKGLNYMFQLMNEARIGVALGAASLAYQGFNYSLDYAKQRPQGRRVTNKDATSPQVPIIEHADVRRMLLAQKAYAEGGLALCFYASSLFEDSRTGETPEIKQRAERLLDLLTPMVKSWPSKYGVKANELAIQVLGGSGYIREYPVEQYYRDNRLNPIHEGTEGIQALDLLGRKVLQNDSEGYNLFERMLSNTIQEASKITELNDMTEQLSEALDRLSHVTLTLTSELSRNPERALANATVYLDMFGRIVVSWLWLKQGMTAQNALKGKALNLDEQNFYTGKLQAARYFLSWELPETQYQSQLLLSLNDVTLTMQPEWF